MNLRITRACLFVCVLSWIPACGERPTPKADEPPLAAIQAPRADDPSKNAAVDSPPTVAEVKTLDRDSKAARPKVVSEDDVGADGLTIDGELTEASTKNSVGRPSHKHPIKLAAGQKYLITLNSKAFDTYLTVYKDKAKLAFDDDGGEGLNSRLIFRATDAGEYALEACSYDKKLGPYCLAIKQTKDVLTVKKDVLTVKKLAKLFDGLDKPWTGFGGKPDSKDGPPAKIPPVRQGFFGPPKIDMGGSPDSTGMSFLQDGDYANAHAALHLALDMRRGILGTTDPRYATSLEHVARLYRAIGDNVSAESALKEALEIRRKNAGEKSASYASCLSALAGLYTAQRKFAKAEELHKEVLEIRRQVHGEKHVEYSVSLNNMGVVYLSRRDFAKAETFFKKSLEIDRELNKESSSLLGNLASLYRQQGDLKRAEEFAKQALDIDKRSLGEHHPRYAGRLIDLALVYQSQEKFAMAESHARQAMHIKLREVTSSARHQSERRQILHRQQLDPYARIYLEITEKMPEKTAATYDLILAWKGSVTVRQRLTRQARLALAENPKAAELFTKLDSISGEIATLSATNSDKLPQGTDLPKKLASLLARREGLEGYLSSITESYRRMQKNQQFTTSELQARLPVGTVLLDFVTYRGKLAVFVVSRDRIERAELGSVKPLANAIESFCASMRPGASDAIQNGPALVLQQKLLRPLEKHLKGAKLLLIAPEGPLCRLPFGALPSSDGKRYLIEDVSIGILPVPQTVSEFLDLPGKIEVGGQTMLALGDVDFDAAPAAAKAGHSEARRIAGLGHERSKGTNQWNRLPGTAKEIDAIEKLFSGFSPKGAVTMLRGDQATKPMLRTKAPGCSYLHLATHGFFASKEVMPSRATDSAKLIVGHNPGFLSGLVLAGANRPPTTDDDGILTALEVGELDLAKVRLAVLSACETGLGETAGGEGVFGLQRAFQIAGAQTVVTTLWSIPDEPTRVLMERFYENHWSKKMGKLDALVEAQQWMLREGRAHAGVQRGIQRLEKTPAPVTTGRLPPYYWAAFVLSGDWR